MDTQLRGELQRLDEGHQAFRTRLGDHSDEHGAALERGLQTVDAELRAEVARLKDTHDESKAGQIAALKQMDSQDAASSTHYMRDMQPFTFAWASILVSTAPLGKGICRVWMRSFALRLHG